MSLVAASGGNILRGMTVDPAVERTAFAAVGDLAGQVAFACLDLSEAVGYAFLPYSA